MALKQTAVLYHYPCPDGAFAALAAHIFFSESSVPPLFFPNTVYSPIKVEELPVDQISDAYLLDFVGPPGFVQQLSPKVDRVIILDHHKTALKMLEDGEFDSENVTKVIDMGRSGATIAYDYFKEKISALAMGNNMSGLCKYERSRRLFEYIEDADLWHWRLHNSKAFSSGLKDSNIEFSLTLNPSLFQQLLSLDVEHVINQGVSSLAHKQTLINEVLDQSYEIVLDDGSYCLAVNADAVSDLRSELGHQLAVKSRNHNLRGIGAVVYRVPELKDELGSNINEFVLYCPIAGTEALSPVEAIGSFGVRNFMLCKKPQVVEEVGDGKPVTVGITRKNSGSWKSWFNKSLNLKVSTH